MSLIRTAIRLCTVQALRNKTFAQARVYDSDNKPLVEVLDVEPRPFVLVYTDNDASEINTSEFGLYSSTRAMTILFEFGQAGAIIASDGTTAQGINIPHTDAAMELGLDFLQAQIIAAFYGDARSPWAELNRLMINRVARTVSVRGGSAKKGGHWAARQLSVICDVISDPVPGEMPLPAEHPLSRFIALAKTVNDQYITPSVTLLETFMTMYPYHDSYASWEIAQERLGMAKRGIRGIGMAPLAETLGGSSPYATEDGADIVQSDDNREGAVVDRISGDNLGEAGEENFSLDKDEEPEPVVKDPSGWTSWPITSDD